MKQRPNTLSRLFSFLAFFILCTSSQDIMFQCSMNPCDLRFDSQLDKVYEPVCAFQPDCTDQTCSTTFDNVCAACSSSDYTQYQRGICASDRNYCSDIASSQYLDSEPVCAFFTSAASKQTISTTVNNAQSACSDSAVSYYKNGACGPSRDSMTYCLPNFRPETCEETSDPVCGFYKENGIQLHHKIMTNACSACQDPTILYHTPGACALTCKSNFGSFMKCDGSKVMPICGTYQNGDTTAKVSLKNSCVGCYNTRFKLISYTEGLCEGDQGIRCENDSAGFISSGSFPVCGIFVDGCSDSTCRQTYADPVSACRDNSVVLYMTGMCPGDEGISCEPYRAKVEQPVSNEIFEIGLSNFCGYYMAGCQDSSCRAGFRTQYGACADESVLFFKPGSCEDD